MKDDTGDPMDPSCERYWRLKDAARPPDGLGDEDAVFLREHRTTCAACVTEEALGGLAADLEHGGPALPLDAAALERLADEVLRLRDARSGPEREPREPRAASAIRLRARTAKPAPRRRVWWAAAAGAGLAAAALLAILLSVPPDEVPSRPLPEPVRVFLAAGTVSGASGSLRAGDVLAAGDFVAVGDGRADLRLCAAVRLFLDAGTRVRLVEEDGGRCSVALDSGRVVASVDHLPVGRSFVVSTPDGTVEVVGTLFAVEVAGDGGEVRVMRGEVKVRGRGGPPRRVLASEAAALAEQTVRPVTIEEAERDRELGWWLGSGDQSGATRVEVTSVPDGAKVLLDNRVLGRSPVSVLLPPGEYRLDLRAEGRLPVREFLQVAPNVPLLRSYVLAPMPSVPTALTTPISAGSADAGALPPPPDAASVLVVAVPAEATIPQAPGPPTQVSSPPPAVVPVESPSAAELLSAARRARTVGDWAAAGDAYRRLMETFPATSEARAALVPYAQLLLDRLGDPAGALRNFEAYFADGFSGGPLAEEASWGRIRALHRLGRTADEVTALRSFLADHAVSPHAGEAHARLLEIAGPPP